MNLKDKKEKEYCVDCNREAAVKLEDCPAYKEKLRKQEERRRRKNE